MCGKGGVLMGGLILMILVTILICGGVPCVAFAYMKAKAKNASDGERANKKALLLTTLILGAFFNCFLFPVYNFTECSTHGWRWHSLFIMLAACAQLGMFLAGAFPYRKGSGMKTVLTLLGVNCIHIFVGMGCRYLLEFGEVSNTYHFTAANMTVHLLAINALCVASWFFAATESQKSAER